MEAPPLRVGLAGISAVAGGADGWADERAAVYAFSVDCRNAPVHSFSERFSSALEKHERMRGAGLLPESIAFPSKRRLRNMTDDVDNVLARGQELARYYTSLLDAARPDAASRQLLRELIGLEWPSASGGGEPTALEGIVALSCSGVLENAPPLLIECQEGSIRRICPADTPPSLAAAQLKASRTVWGDVLRSLLNSRKAAEPEPEPEPAPAARAPTITDARLRHGLLHVGLSVRVEFRSRHCSGVRRRWFRRKPLESSRCATLSSTCTE